MTRTMVASAILTTNPVEATRTASAARDSAHQERAQEQGLGQTTSGPDPHCAGKSQLRASFPRAE